jgi:hypothetical protein
MTTRKIGAAKAATMTEDQITLAVFKGAHPSELRGLSDAFSDDGIRALASNKLAGEWRWRACEALI